MVFEGTWIDGKMEGEMRFRRIGALEEGEVGYVDMRRGVRHGKERLFNGLGRATVFHYEQGRMLPTMRQVNGKRTTGKRRPEYKGEFNENFERHGRGEFLYEGGERYEGEWSSGSKNGQGTLTFADGSKYEGTWVMNLKEGEGRFTFANGEVFTGTYYCNRRDGDGEYAYRNGDVYAGEWREGKKDGWGTMYFSDGGMYTGEWKDGIQHGAGKRTYSNGKNPFQGTFEHGKRRKRDRYPCSELPIVQKRAKC